MLKLLAPLVLVISVCAPHSASAAEDVCEAKPRKRGLFDVLVEKTIDVLDEKTGGGLGSRNRSTLNSVLIDFLACKLTPSERDKAAEATVAVAGQPVGTTANWESSERPGVVGGSTVMSQADVADGTVCQDIKDVQTIDGEEQFLTKTMCRAPGEYSFKPVQVSA